MNYLKKFKQTGAQIFRANSLSVLSLSLSLSVAHTVESSIASPFSVLASAIIFRPSSRAAVTKPSVRDKCSPSSSGYLKLVVLESKLCFFFFFFFQSFSSWPEQERLLGGDCARDFVRLTLVIRPSSLRFFLMLLILVLGCRGHRSVFD